MPPAAPFPFPFPLFALSPVSFPLNVIRVFRNTELLEEKGTFAFDLTVLPTMKVFGAKQFVGQRPVCRAAKGAADVEAIFFVFFAFCFFKKIALALFPPLILLSDAAFSLAPVGFEKRYIESGGTHAAVNGDVLHTLHTISRAPMATWPPLPQ